LRAQSPGSGPGESASTSDIPEPPAEVRLDDLARAEANKEYIENRPERLASDLLEQKHKLQKHIFYIAIAVICSFYLFFLLTVMGLVCSPQHDLFKTGFPATATVLIGMLGSIPTILTAFLLSGLFKEKEHKEKDKDKEDKSLLDVSTVAKIVAEALKAAKH
jgi:uncharacterized membrane protein YqjE